MQISCGPSSRPARVRRRGRDPSDKRVSRSGFGRRDLKGSAFPESDAHGDRQEFGILARGEHVVISDLSEHVQGGD